MARFVHQLGDRRRPDDLQPLEPLLTKDLNQLFVFTHPIPRR